MIISDNSGFEKKPINTFTIVDMYAVIGEDDKEFAINTINLEVEETNTQSSGVHAYVYILGERLEKKDGNNNVIAVDYNEVLEEVKIGAAITVRIISQINDEKEQNFPLIKGVIKAVSTQETEVGTFLAATISSAWDNIPSIPVGALSTVAASTGNELISYSRLLSNEKNITKRVMRRLKMSASGKCDIATAIATMLDSTENLFLSDKEKFSTVIRDAIDLEDAPKLVSRDTGNKPILLYLSRMYARNIINVPRCALLLELLAEFMLLLAPRHNKKTGEWKPKVIPNNAFTEPQARIPLYAIVARQTVKDNKNNAGFGCVAVQYKVRPKKDTTVELSGVCLCAAVRDGDDCELEILDDLSVSERNELLSKDKETGLSKTVGGTIVKELPEWIDLTKSPGEKDTKLSYKKKWAKAIAKQIFACSFNRGNKVVLDLQLSQYTKVLNLVGKVVEVSTHNKDTALADWDVEEKSSSYYGVVTGIELYIEMQANNFKTALRVTLDYVRSYKEQDEFEIDNDDMFDWDGEED